MLGSSNIFSLVKYTKCCVNSHIYSLLGNSAPRIVFHVMICNTGFVTVGYLPLFRWWYLVVSTGPRTRRNVIKVLLLERWIIHISSFVHKNEHYCLTKELKFLKQLTLTYLLSQQNFCTKSFFPTSFRPLARFPYVAALPSLSIHFINIW